MSSFSKCDTPRDSKPTVSKRQHPLQHDAALGEIVVLPLNSVEPLWSMEHVVAQHIDDEQQPS